MCLRAVWRLKGLKALQASTWITASNCGRLNSCCMACTATSYPPSKPAQSWSGPTMSWMRVMDIAFSMIRRKVSPIPIGLTPGHLSSAINLHATKPSNLFGSKKAVQIVFAREGLCKFSLQGRRWHHTGQKNVSEMTCINVSILLHQCQMGLLHHPSSA